MKKIYLLLLLTWCLGLILRFYQLGKISKGLEWDEVAIGYDAYSVLKTGKDQYGQFLPLTFRSLDDYKPPLYEYLAIPPTYIFGLNEFSTRLPSALAGTLSVAMVFFLVLEFFKNNGLFGRSTNRKLALLSAFFLSISPWHLQFSRAAFEVNLSILLIICAVYFFLKAVKGHNSNLIISVVFFGLGLFSYHSSRILIPCLLLFLIIVNFAYLRKNWRDTVVPFIVLTGFFVLFLPILFSANAQIRFKVTNITNIFNDLNTTKDINNAQAVDNRSQSDWLFRIFHGRKQLLVRTFIYNYTSFFSPDFLFFKADVPLHHAPDFGLLYLAELPFLLLGIYVYLRYLTSRYSLILLVWFLLAPIPASVTLQVPHAVRAEIFLPTFQIFTAIGLIFLFKRYNSKSFTLFITGSCRSRIPNFISNSPSSSSGSNIEIAVWDALARVTRFTIIVLMFLEINKYLHQYYVHTPFELSDKWMDGRKEAALYVDSIKQNYEKVVVSVKLEQPHVFFLYYLKYDPFKYLSQGGTISGGWAEDRNKFDKYEFRYINHDEYVKTCSRCLLVVGAGEVADGVTGLKTIYYSNGKPAIKIIDL